MALIPQRVSAGDKLSLALAAAFGMIVLAALFGFAKLYEANRIASDVRDAWLPRMELLRELKLAMDRTSLLTTRQLQTTNFRHLAEIASVLKNTEARIDAATHAYRSASNSDVEREALAALTTAWMEWRGAHRAILELLESGDATRAMRTFEARSRPAFDMADARLGELMELASEESRIASERAESIYDTALGIALVAIALGALAGAAAVAWTRRHICAPVLDLAGAVQRLAEGDLTLVPPWTSRQDEIGILAAAVSGYRDSLLRGQQLVHEAELERQRLRAAVTHMPVGLCMFDASGQLVASNDRFAELYDLRADLLHPGTRLEELTSGRCKAGNKPAHQDSIALLSSKISGGQPGREVFQLPGERAVSVVHQALPDGGWVAIHEDVTERLQAEARIAYLAHHDALTTLPNRLLFREKIEEAVARSRRGEGFALLCLDLDRFKAVNDTLGHPVGDALLRAVTERLRAQIRETDVASRLGGDEFAIIQSGLEQASDAAALARRLVDALSQPYELDGHQVVIGTSIGIALLPDDGIDADTLLKHADLALYRAKAAGRGTWRFFEVEMDTHMQARRALELDLRRGLTQGEFELFYQPVLNLQSREINAFEALIRWRHPERGLVSPGEFIPLAEEIGLIVQLGEWVLHRACSDAKAWPAQIRLAVNLSPAQLNGGSAIAAVSSALRESGLSPSRLELEITETVVLEDAARISVILGQLKELGVHIAMDDFGSGYCSLSYLRQFPFDRVKIDRSFVQGAGRDAGDGATIRAIVDLCRSLGMVVTAEGVETEDHLRGLVGSGIDVQGFLFSRPRPANELSSLWQRAPDAMEHARVV